jgi:catechol 2,3-dioxygenase-like lactoylglutathione lyase family enzyme
MIDGIHAILYTDRATEVRTFLRDVLGFGLVDEDPDWPIFALPGSELGVHPAEAPTRVELYLLTRDLDATLVALRAKGVEIVRPVEDQRWGLVSALRLPDGSKLPIYQPRHSSVLDGPKR